MWCDKYPVNGLKIATAEGRYEDAYLGGKLFTRHWETRRLFEKSVWWRNAGVGEKNLRLRIADNRAHRYGEIPRAFEENGWMGVAKVYYKRRGALPSRNMENTGGACVHMMKVAACKPVG